MFVAILQLVVEDFNNQSCLFVLYQFVLIVH
jgi:hypothetical protein